MTTCKICCADYVPGSTLLSTVLCSHCVTDIQYRKYVIDGAEPIDLLELFFVNDPHLSPGVEGLTPKDAAGIIELQPAETYHINLTTIRRVDGCSQAAIDGFMGIQYPTEPTTAKPLKTMHQVKIIKGHSQSLEKDTNRFLEKLAKENASVLNVRIECHQDKDKIIGGLVFTAFIVYQKKV
jgi:hypothetical protein